MKEKELQKLEAKKQGEKGDNAVMDMMCLYEVYNILPGAKTVE